MDIIRSISFKGYSLSVQTNDEGALEVHIHSGENLLGDGIPHVIVYVDDAEVYNFEDELFDDEDEEVTYVPYSELRKQREQRESDR